MYSRVLLSPFRHAFLKWYTCHLNLVEHIHFVFSMMLSYTVRHIHRAKTTQGDRQKKLARVSPVHSRLWQGKAGPKRLIPAKGNTHLSSLHLISLQSPNNLARQGNLHNMARRQTEQVGKPQGNTNKPAHSKPRQGKQAMAWKGACPSPCPPASSNQPNCQCRVHKLVHAGIPIPLPSTTHKDMDFILNLEVPTKQTPPIISQPQAPPNLTSMVMCSQSKTAKGPDVARLR